MPGMTQEQFMAQYVYALKDDFKSIYNGEPATWAPNHPMRWGQELHKITVNSSGSSLSPGSMFTSILRPHTS
ncbi:hypothetical protein B7463_g4501, partial [Scytalidium lignicola]